MRARIGQLTSVAIQHMHALGLSTLQVRSHGHEAWLWVTIG